MAYVECEAGVQALLQSLTTYFPTTDRVAVKDYSILNKGVMSAAVILPSTVARGKPSSGNYQRAWGMLLDLFYGFSDLYTAMTAFETMRAAVIQAIDRNPNLVIAPATSGVIGVYDTEINSDSEIVPYPATGPAQFVAQRFRVTVYQSIGMSQ